MSTSADGRWHPGIGDPNVTGWVTVAAYVAAMVMCAVCAAREPTRGRRRFVWAAFALTMAFLGVNKQLDLQTWFTEIGRDMAQAEGWYAVRQTVQALFIAALAGAGAIGLVWLLHLLRGLGSELRCAALGLLLLAVFVVARAASFHHVDRLLGIELASGVRLNALLELTGIGIVAGAAAARLLRRSAGRVRAATD